MPSSLEKGPWHLYVSSCMALHVTKGSNALRRALHQDLTLESEMHNFGCRCRFTCSWPTYSPAWIFDLQACKHVSWAEDVDSPSYIGDTHPMRPRFAMLAKNILFRHFSGMGRNLYIHCWPVKPDTWLTALPSTPRHATRYPTSGSGRHVPATHASGWSTNISRAAEGS